MCLVVCGCVFVGLVAFSFWFLYGSFSGTGFCAGFCGHLAVQTFLQMCISDN